MVLFLKSWEILSIGICESLPWKIKSGIFKKGKLFQFCMGIFHILILISHDNFVKKQCSFMEHLAQIHLTAIEQTRNLANISYCTHVIIFFLHWQFPKHLTCIEKPPFHKLSSSIIFKVFSQCLLSFTSIKPWLYEMFLAGASLKITNFGRKWWVSWQYDAYIWNQSNVHDGLTTFKPFFPLGKLFT